MSMGLAMPFGFTSCGTESDDGSSNTADDSLGIMRVADQFSVSVAKSSDGSSVTIETDSIPDYKSYYFGSSSPNYDASTTPSNPNPNRIIAQGYTFTLPYRPAKKASSSATPMGPVGVTTNGVVIYNNQAAPPDNIMNEVATFDTYTGHPTNTGSYHYHLEPTSITNNDSALVGVMLDGFPIYGRKDTDGSTPSNLDNCNGHTGVTQDFPEGIYHYHITLDTTHSAYFINGNGACNFGTMGDVTQ